MKNLPKAKALALKREVEALKRGRRGIKTKEILAFAKKNKKSAWHKHLEWDDTKAGDSWRLKQIGDTMRVISFTYVESPVTEEKIIVPTYVSVPENGSREYEETREVLSDAPRREHLLRRTLYDLMSIKEVALFEELEEVFVAIRKAARDYLSAEDAAEYFGEASHAESRRV